MKPQIEKFSTVSTFLIMIFFMGIFIYHKIPHHRTIKTVSICKPDVKKWELGDRIPRFSAIVITEGGSVLYDKNDCTKSYSGGNLTCGKTQEEFPTVACYKETIETYYK